MTDTSKEAIENIIRAMALGVIDGEDVAGVIRDISAERDALKVENTGLGNEINALQAQLTTMLDEAAAVGRQAVFDNGVYEADAVSDAILALKKGGAE